jgi:molybdenum cofactor biosynthesis protein MoaC
MVNITHKSSSLRKAVATALVKTSSPETIAAIEQRKVPKGDVFEFARAAGLLAIKKTSDVIPDCHPLPVEYASITFAIEGLSVIVSTEVHTIYKTGVEVEAMHGAAVTALVMYDMLKPIDKKVEIEHIGLKQKTGGKSDMHVNNEHQLKCAVVVCSDTISRGEKQDTAGKAIIATLEKNKLSCNTYEIIPDDFKKIQSTLLQLCDNAFDLVIFTGGTGLSARDVTPDAVSPLIEQHIPGIMETARSYGQSRNRYAMLSRGVAGFVKNTLVLTLPGSKGGAEETMEALFPHLLHVFDVRRGIRHNNS